MAFTIVKYAIPVVLAMMFESVAIFLLWGTIYWHWETTRQLPIEEIEQARLDSYSWVFYLIVSQAACLACVVAILWMSFLDAIKVRPRGH